MKPGSEAVLREVAERYRRLASGLGFVPESQEVMVQHLKHKLVDPKRHESAGREHG